MFIRFQQLKTFQETLNLARVRDFLMKEEKNLLCYQKFEEVQQDRRKEGRNKSIQHSTNQVDTENDFTPKGQNKKRLEERQ